MVLLTGATGFVGEALLRELLLDGRHVVCATRGSSRPVKCATVHFDLERPEELDRQALRGIECVYHLAARVHVMRREADADRTFHAHNAHATQVLARACADAGVRRFVYVSSIKVNGERTHGRPFRADDTPAPQDAYGRSKRAAEDTLAAISRETGMELVVVRPPLVYGPGCGANFLRLMSLLARGTPLPLASVHNRRSLVSVWNLVSLLKRVGEHGAASGKTWLVSDDEDVSTPQLLRTLSAALGREARLWSVPVPLLRGAGAMLGRGAEIARLVDSLQLEVGETRARLGWQPPVTFASGIERTARWYLEARAG